MRRFVLGAATLWAAVTLAFFGLRLAAGDPVAGLLSQGLATPEQAARLRESLGLDQPLLAQYARFLVGLGRGDLGASLYSHRPVATIIGEQAAATAGLALGGLSVAIFLGVALGVAAGAFPRSLPGRAAGTLADLATAVPAAVTGIGVLWAAASIAASLPVLRPLTRGGSLLLPSLALGFASCGALARVVQSGLLENLEAPYILAVRARGVGRGPRLIWHALRPTLPLAISFLSLETALLLGGAVVTETVFARPGLGRLLVTSILAGDFPVVQGLVLLTAAAYTLSTILADSLSSLIDPRLRGAT